MAYGLSNIPSMSRSYSLPSDYKSQSVEELQGLRSSAPAWAAEFVTGKVDPIIALRHKEAEQATATPATTSAPTVSGSMLTDASRSAIQTAMDEYGPEGGFGEGVEAALDRSRRKFMSSGMQNLASAGLAGTSQMGTLATKFAEEVEAPALAGVESERASRLSQLNSLLSQMEQTSFEAQSNRELTERQAAANRETQTNIAGMGSDAQMAIAGMGQAGATNFGRPETSFPSLYDVQPTMASTPASTGFQPVNVDDLMGGLDLGGGGGTYERFSPGELENLASTGGGLIQGGQTPAMTERSLYDQFSAIMALH